MARDGFGNKVSEKGPAVDQRTRPFEGQLILAELGDPANASDVVEGGSLAGTTTLAFHVVTNLPEVLETVK